MVTCPPTAYMVHSISSLAVAVDTLGEYNWRHRGDFSISTFITPNRPLLGQNLRKNFFQFFGLLCWFGGVQGGN